MEGIENWKEAKDTILMFLCSGIAVWIGYEVRALRESIERLMIQVEIHEVRLNTLERKDDNKS
jgi:hypothetical protein